MRDGEILIPKSLSKSKEILKTKNTATKSTRSVAKSLKSTTAKKKRMG
jgi:hypothetical protein